MNLEFFITKKAKSGKRTRTRLLQPYINKCVSNKNFKIE